MVTAHTQDVWQWTACRRWRCSDYDAHIGKPLILPTKERFTNFEGNLKKENLAKHEFSNTI